MYQSRKVTPITLLYFNDTGFYYSVDTTRHWKTYFGKNKGCNFAYGNSTESP